MTLLSALCSDDYYEDTAGHCSAISAGEVFTLEAILEKYDAIVTRDADVEISPRARDDLQHLRGRCLLLQRLAEVVRALA
jgi:hypothetical protein